MRATTEKVNGVGRGRYLLREGLATGLLACQFTPRGDLIVGEPTAGGHQRATRVCNPATDWTGVVPFEIKTINARSDGFLLTFTNQLSVRSQRIPIPIRYRHSLTFTSRAMVVLEVDQTKPKVVNAIVSKDGRRSGSRLRG